MKVVKFVVIMLLLVLETREDTENAIIFKSADEIVKEIDKLVNGMFTTLMLTPLFMESEHVRRDLQTYKFLRNTAKINHKIYIHICNITKPDHKKSNIDNDVDNIINEIVKENVTFSNMTAILIEEFSTKGYPIHETSRLKRDEETDNLSFELIINFLNKINGMKKDDFVLTEEKVKMPEIETSDYIDIWEPQSTEVTDSRRIYGAKTTSITKYSFIVSIAMDGWAVCAGSIISSDTVITAASCLQKLLTDIQEGRELSKITLRAGSDYEDSLGAIFLAKKAIFHPKFNPFNLKNNIVLLQLNKSQLAKKHFKRILINRIDYIYSSVNTTFKVLGWGRRDDSRKFKKLPLGLDRLQWYNWETCQNAYDTYVTENNFCLSSARGGGACEKDLGAPAVYNGKLVGIVSFSTPDCGAVNSPTVFVKLAPFADWIDSVVQKGSTGPKKRIKQKVNTKNTPESLKDFFNNEKGISSKELSKQTSKDFSNFFQINSKGSKTSKANSLEKSRDSVADIDFESETVLGYHILKKIKDLLTLNTANSSKNSKKSAVTKEPTVLPKVVRYSIKYAPYFSRLPD